MVGTGPNCAVRLTKQGSISTSRLESNRIALVTCIGCFKCVHLKQIMANVHIILVIFVHTCMQLLKRWLC